MSSRLLRIKMAVAGVLGRKCGVCKSLGYWAFECHQKPPPESTLQVGHPNGRKWSIRRVNTMTRWMRYLREALAGKVQAECGPCNRKHGGGIRYKRVDKTRQGAKRRRELAIGRAVERVAAENSHEFWKSHG